MSVRTPSAKITPIRAELSPMDKPRRGGGSWWLPAVVVVALGGGAYLGYRYLYEQSAAYVIPAGQVTIAPVATGPFVEYIALRGQVVPAVTVSVAPDVSGRIVEVLVDPGDTVRAGDPVVRIVNPGFELEILSHEAQATEQITGQKSMQISARARTDQIERDMAAASFRRAQLEGDIARLEPLVATGSQPSSSLDKLRQELAYQLELTSILARQAKAAAEAAREIEASLATMVNLLGDIHERRVAQLGALTIRAPTDGVISGLDIVPGQQVEDGQAIGAVDADDGFEVVFVADEFFLPRVAVGQRVIALIGQSEFEMVVTDTSPGVENGQFRVDAAFAGDDLPAHLLRGQAISGRLITGGASEGVVSLPVGPFLESSGGQWAYVVGDDGRAVKTPIAIGRRTNERVEILSGLAVGDRVITSEYGTFAHLDTVRVGQEVP